MHIDDCLVGTLQLLDADPGLLSRSHVTGLGPTRTYHIAAVSFTPEELHHAICAVLDRYVLVVGGQTLEVQPKFSVCYDQVDPVRAEIAASWPERLDDSLARRVWQWRPEYDTLDALVEKMMMEMGRLNGVKLIPRR
jgi:hypothetical protein